MPRDEEMQWIEMVDFSPGIHSNNLLAGGVNVTSDNPCLAQPTGTYRCTSLPTGGLGPLPRLQASQGLTTTPDDGNGYDYRVAGFGSWGRILNSPATSSTPQQTELHVVLYWDFPAGGGSNYTAKLYWLRERAFDDTPSTETIRALTETLTGNSGPRYSYLLKTRMNPTVPDDLGSPVMVCVANRVANNDMQISRAWPDPATPTTLNSIIVGAVLEDDPYVIAAAHQSRIVFGRWGAYDHGPDASLITNENILWTETNDNTLVSTTPAQFVPELDQSITDMCPMSANALLVVKWYGGGYVLQGDLSDVTVVQLPNLPCPDGSDYVRGVNTSKGYIYSAGDAGMYIWNGGDGAELISGQLDGNFAVGDNFITGANGQCDRWIDKVLVPRNWLLDTNTGGWWRIEDPATVDIRFWSTVAYEALAYGAEVSFTDATNDSWIHRFQYDDLAYTWSWKSHPLWISQVRRLEVRAGIVALQGHGTVTITLEDELGNSNDHTISVDHDNIRNYRFNISQDAENMIVTIEASGDNGSGAGTYEAPLLHRMFLGHKPAQHLALSTN